MHRAATFLIGIATSLGVGQAQAGAWPRGEGNHFVSSAVYLHQGKDSDWTSLTYFHEYGLTPDLTIGADIGGAISDVGKAVLFLAYPLPPMFGLNIGGQIGIGTVDRQPVLRPGISFGRGSEKPSGWIVTDAVLEYFIDDQTYDWKVDTTFGLNVTEGLKLYGQIQSGQIYGDLPYARLEGSAAVRLRPGLDLDLGASSGLYNSDDLRLKIGIWRSFLRFHRAFDRA
ncbi:hypothetical protein [Pseudooceanicola algae]|uniref:Outer membrane protein beta-barrel domain-containing protein n=1 Tax=Pseudooceanicola algae TaxID=1537215 RepID=A0A418SJF5_9RHOB|nr:hypothetical protein [Pseudooceanicola algae]QPM91860.1 hypothetical protein PSAL_031220 [Pseudooceanicola algae]